MHYGYVDFINLSNKVQENLIELTLDCREINLLQEENLRLLCSKIKNCASLEKCTLICTHVHEGFMFDSDQCRNIRFVANGNGHRYIDMHNHRHLTTFNVGLLAVLALCFIYYLSTLQLEFHSKYYVGFINAALTMESLMLLLVWNLKELYNNIAANKKFNEIKQLRLELLSQAFAECSLIKDQPKVASYRDVGDGFISLQQEYYFLDIPVEELCESIKYCLEERIFTFPETDAWSTAGAVSTATSLNSLSMHNNANTNNYHSLTQPAQQIAVEAPAKKLRMSI